MINLEARKEGNFEENGESFTRYVKLISGHGIDI